MTRAAKPGVHSELLNIGATNVLNIRSILFEFVLSTLESSYPEPSYLKRGENGGVNLKNWLDEL